MIPGPSRSLCCEGQDFRAGELAAAIRAATPSSDRRAWYAERESSLQWQLSTEATAIYSRTSGRTDSSAASSGSSASTKAASSSSGRNIRKALAWATCKFLLARSCRTKSSTAVSSTELAGVFDQFVREVVETSGRSVLERAKGKRGRSPILRAAME
jgi:hypothetical protein